MGCPAEAAKCVVHLGRSYPREDPSCSGPVPTAKTTLNPAHVRPERRALHNDPRLDDTINPLSPDRNGANTAPMCFVDRTNDGLNFFYADRRRTPRRLASHVCCPDAGNLTAASAHGLNSLVFLSGGLLSLEQAVGTGVRGVRSGPTPRSQWADHLPEEWRRERRSKSRRRSEPRGGARGGVCLTRPSCASSLTHDYPDRRHDHHDRFDGGARARRSA